MPCSHDVPRCASRWPLRTALASALTAMAALAAAAGPATGLAPGKAKGTLTINGQAATFTHAYSAREANPFDEKKDDIVILLTDRPLEPAALAGELSSAARGLKTCMVLKLRDDPERAKFSGILQRWVMGSRLMAHEALKGKAMQSSPDFDSKVDAVVIGPDRVEGTVYTEQAASSFQGDKFEYRVSFNAAVKPRAK